MLDVMLFLESICHCISPKLRGEFTLILNNRRDRSKLNCHNHAYSHYKTPGRRSSVARFQGRPQSKHTRNESAVLDVTPSAGKEPGLCLGPQFRPIRHLPALVLLLADAAADAVDDVVLLHLPRRGAPAPGTRRVRCGRGRGRRGLLHRRVRRTRRAVGRAGPHLHDQLGADPAELRRRRGPGADQGHRRPEVGGPEVS